jgi:hypothetical protein
MIPKYLTRAMLASVIAVSALGAPLRAQAQSRVWMFPSAYENGREFKALFASPGTWLRTRQHIAGLGYADHALNSQFNDQQLRAWLPQIARWGLKFGLEVGAVKPQNLTGQAAFDRDHRFWDRFTADGAHIDTIAMDEPYVATLTNLRMPMAYGVEQTADFVALVRRAYPSMEIGDIEPYPHFQLDEIFHWIDALQARLRQMGVKGLDFFRLDVDWMHFRPGDAKGQLGWQGVRMIEDGCRRRGIAFSLVYWAANYPSLRQAGQQSETTWTTAILDEARRYAAAGGRPDEYVVESWLLSQDEAVPTEVMPDSNPNTMTGSVLALEARTGQLR